MMWLVTAPELSVLRKLMGTRGTMGLNPCSFGGPRSSRLARKLAAKGYVEICTLSPSHFRYRITSSGEQTIRFIDAGRPWLVRGGLHLDGAAA